MDKQIAEIKAALVMALKQQDTLNGYIQGLQTALNVLESTPETDANTDEDKG